MRSLLLAGFTALAFASAAHAQNARESGLTGQTLVKLCTPSDPKSVEACEAYINGVADSAYFYQVLRPANGSKGPPLPGYLCIPPATTGQQLREKVVGYVQSKQDQGSRAASGVVLRALDESFKCPAAPKAAPKP
jgi:hypothetical protein